MRSLYLDVVTDSHDRVKQFRYLGMHKGGVVRVEEVSQGQTGGLPYAPLPVRQKGDQLLGYRIGILLNLEVGSSPRNLSLHVPHSSSRSSTHSRWIAYSVVPSNPDRNDI